LQAVEHYHNENKTKQNKNRNSFGTFFLQQYFKFVKKKLRKTKHAINIMQNYTMATTLNKQKYFSLPPVVLCREKVVSNNQQTMSF